MAYGILIKNGSDRVQIDSDAGIPTLYQSLVTTNGNLTSADFENLVFATNASGAPLYRKGNVITGASDIRVFKASTDGLTVPTTGFGLNIFNSTGGCVYSATSTTLTMELILLSTISLGLSTYIDIPMPSSTYALSTGRIYVLMNTSQYVGTPGFGGTKVFYELKYDTGSFGTVRLNSYTTSVYGDPGGRITTIDPVSNGNALIIGYLRG